MAKPRYVRRTSRFDDGRHAVGAELAGGLIETAKRGVGAHHGPAYRVQVRDICQDLDLRRRRLAEREGDIERLLEEHEVGTLLTGIDGIGTQTAARLIAELGGPARFASPAALAAYVGVVPSPQAIHREAIRPAGRNAEGRFVGQSESFAIAQRSVPKGGTAEAVPRGSDVAEGRQGLKHPGERQPARAGITPIGHARLRTKLWMPTLTAIRRNPWLRAFYEGLRARGKLPKVALVAALRKLLHAIYSVAKNREPFTLKAVEG